MKALNERINEQKQYAIRTAVIALVAYVLCVKVVPEVFPKTAQLMNIAGFLVFVIAIRILTENVTIIFFGRKKKYEMSGATGEALSEFFITKARQDKNTAMARNLKAEMTMVTGCVFFVAVGIIAMKLTFASEYVKPLFLLTVIVGAMAGYYKGQATVLTWLVEEDLQKDP